MNFFKKIGLSTTLVLFFSNNIFAQGLGDPECDPVLGCPIDDNVWILFAAVIFIALYKVFNSNKKMLNL
jgi:hypothetical protein